MKKPLILLFSLTLGIMMAGPCVSLAFANHKAQVLGTATTATELSFPQTAEGPGFILPDSQLFFLDELKQNLRLLFAFSPSTKAQVYSAVAGERLAELQFMLAKNHTKGIRTALLGVSDNLQKAAQNLSAAKLRGKDTRELAKSLNDSIKDKQKKLSFLEKKATGEIKAQVKTVREGLKLAKVEVEDMLPEDLLKNEMEEDLNQEMAENMEESVASARDISRAVDVLTNLSGEQASNKVLMDASRKTVVAVEAVENAVLGLQVARSEVEKEIDKTSNN